jgi:hypothetical protein
MGRTHLVQHDIDTGNARPIKCCPRRLPLARQQACGRALWNMLQADIIKPSDSPWASAVVIGPQENRWLAALLRLEAGEWGHQERFLSPAMHRHVPGLGLGVLLVLLLGSSLWMLSGTSFPRGKTQDSLLHQTGAVAVQGTKFWTLQCPCHICEVNGQGTF